LLQEVENLGLPAKMNINRATKGTLAELSVGMKKQKPAANRDQAMFGKVNNNRFRLPNVSIV